MLLESNQNSDTCLVFLPIVLKFLRIPLMSLALPIFRLLLSNFFLIFDKLCIFSVLNIKSIPLLMEFVHVFR
jgi:hypothetical protein